MQHVSLFSVLNIFMPYGLSGISIAGNLQLYDFGPHHIHVCSGIYKQLLIDGFCQAWMD